MDLRCKVFHAADALVLEGAINHFLADEITREGEVQLEEITQSEGPGGVTVTLWYSLVERDEEMLDELDDDRQHGELA